MKKMIVTSALILMATTNAFAGAYDLSCTSADGSVKIGKGTLTVDGKKYAYFSQVVETRLMGYDLVDFLQVTGPKVVVSSPDAPNDVAMGGVKIIKEKNYDDECGNTGTETKYKEAIGIYNMDGTALMKVARIVCTETAITGHCY